VGRGGGRGGGGAPPKDPYKFAFKTTKKGRWENEGEESSSQGSVLAPLSEQGARFGVKSYYRV
jgi:hypothetical protein